MNVEIPCELYSRMIEIPKLLDDAETRRYLRSLYIERKNKRVYVVVTNVKLAAIQHLGIIDGPDEAIAICIDDQLMEVCDKETPFNGKLSIVSNPVLGYTAIKSTFGFQFPGNAHIALPDNNAFKDWRTWLPDQLPNASHGAMYWNAFAVEALATASTSGGICFPEFIDTSKPILINDDNDPNWIGIFFNKIGNQPPAILPDWV